MTSEQARIFDEMYDSIAEDPNRFSELYLSNPEMRQYSSWLYSAARGGDPVLVKFLLGQNHSPNERSRSSVEQRALCAACGEASSECVQLLLDAGAETRAKSIDDDALLDAITGRSLECAKLLVDAGIDIHSTYVLEDGRLRNALEYAERWGCPDIADYLRSKGAVMPTESSGEAEDDSVVSLLKTKFGSEPPANLGTVGLGQEHSPADLLLFDVGSTDFPFRTVITNGLAKHPILASAFGEERSRVELMMHLPFTWPVVAEEPLYDAAEYRWPLDWMRSLALRILDGSLPLAGTHMIMSNESPLEPLGAGTQQSCFLLIGDFYPFFPVMSDRSEPVHFYHVIPLYGEERDFERSSGMQPLLESMSTHGLDSLVVRPERERFV